MPTPSNVRKAKQHLAAAKKLLVQASGLTLSKKVHKLYMDWYGEDKLETLFKPSEMFTLYIKEAVHSPIKPYSDLITWVKQTGSRPLCGFVEQEPDIEMLVIFVGDEKAILKKLQSLGTPPDEDDLWGDDEDDDEDDGRFEGEP